jgi:hypothetical protein
MADGSPDGILHHVSRTLAAADWAVVWLFVPGVGMLAAGGYQFCEARSFLSSSAPTTGVITAMKDTSTSEGYNLCSATVEVPVGSTRSHAHVRLGGYWPEAGGSCAKVGDNLVVRYSLTDPGDVRPATTIGSDAQPLLVMGLFFSLPLFVLCRLAFVSWWSSRSS